MKVKTRVEFDRILQDWDGFGVNYVETAQTRDYEKDPQEYGGLSTLSEEKRMETIELIFGDDGLRPGLVKMFLDPFHQKQSDGKSEIINLDHYDHTTTTEWMRCFVRKGLEVTRRRGHDLTILTDLYGPPPFMTKQKVLRGRDLDQTYEVECAKYIASFAKYLREKEEIPIKYVGIHNEGEDWERWPEEGTDNDGLLNHDYNMYWSPESVAKIIPVVRDVLDKNSMTDVAVTPGETSNWTRFHTWGYADAIADNPAALDALGLITSHGFAGFGNNRWFGDWRSAGIDIIREKKPELHAWVTSTSWAGMDARFIWEIFNTIYCAKVNGIIPWACIQNPSLWVGGDPNPGNAIQVDGKGDYEVRPGYYFYKQVCRAGQPGMGIARVRSNDTVVALIGFAKARSKNPDSVVAINIGSKDKDVEIELCSSSYTHFESFRSSKDENYVPVGEYSVDNGPIIVRLPAESVTTFFGRD